MSDEERELAELRERAEDEADARDRDDRAKEKAPGPWIVEPKSDHVEPDVAARQAALYRRMVSRSISA